MGSYFPRPQLTLYNSVSNIVQVGSKVGALTQGQIWVIPDDDSDDDHESACCNFDVSTQSSTAKETAIGLRLPSYTHLDPRRKILFQFELSANINTVNGSAFEHVQPQLLTVLTEPTNEVGTYTSLFTIPAQYFETTQPQATHVYSRGDYFLNPADTDKLYLGFEFKYPSTNCTIDPGSKVSILYNFWTENIRCIDFNSAKNP